MVYLIPNSKIITNQYLIKNIEDVRPNDLILNFENKFEKIISISEQIYNGNLLKIQISKNIPIYVDEKNLFVVNGKFVQSIIHKYFKSNINKNKSRILGLYAAEGSFHRNEVLFSLGKHEQDMAEEYVEKIKTEYINSFISTRVSLNKLTIAVRNDELKNDCLKHVGQYSFQKKLSKEIIFGGKDVKKHFIVGWMDGDGHVDKSSGKLVGTTISTNLAYQIRIMLNSLKIDSSLYEEIPKNGGNINGRQIVGKHNIFRLKIAYNNAKQLMLESNKLNFNKNIKNVKRVSFDDKYFFMKINKINKIQYNDVVYKIETENKSPFLMNGVIITGN